jgi:hypothetical protein
MRKCASFVALLRAGGAAAIAILYKPEAMLAIETPACRRPCRLSRRLSIIKPPKLD